MDITLQQSEKMNLDSLCTNIDKSEHGPSLTKCVTALCHQSENYSNKEPNKDETVIKSEKVRSICKPSDEKARIHILVSDQNGRTLFDSDRYIKSLFIHVFDEDGNLIYPSIEHTWNRDKKFETAADRSAENTTKTKTAKIMKLKKKCNIKEVRKVNKQIHMQVDAASNIKDSKCNEKKIDYPPRESSKTMKQVLKNVPYVAIERLTDLKHKNKAVNSNNGLEVLVNVPTDNEIQTHIKNDAASLESNVHDESSASVARKQKRIKRSRLPSAKIDKDMADVTESTVCDICGVKYKSLLMLNRHKLVHEVEHTDSKNPLQCPLCNKVYPNWRSLTVHKRKHDATKDNVCEKCGKCFRTKQELVRHEFVHSSAKSSPCHICGKLFKNKAYAQMHSKLHSAENRKHVCKLCGKHFLRGPDIQKHMRIHTGEKPFICSHCGRSFSESSHLIRHERLHTGEKPYKCDKCDVSFTHKEVLVRHSFTHMEHLPFSCEVCNKGFKTKRELDNHWLVHDKPTDPALNETCNICGKVFSHVLYLQYHMRTHNNLGTFECPVCRKVFKKLSYLKQHAANQHAYSAFPIELGVESLTDIPKPDLLGINVKEFNDPIIPSINDPIIPSINDPIIPSINDPIIPSISNGSSAQAYTDMSSEFCQLLLQLETDQTKRNINSAD